MNRTLLATGLVLAIATPALAQDEGAAANWQKVVVCAQSDSEERRHECIDRVLADSGVLSDSKRIDAIAVDERKNFGLTQVQQEEAQRRARVVAPGAGPVSQPDAAAPPPSQTPPVVAVLPSTTPAEPRRPAPAEPERIDTIVTMIAKSFDPGNRMLVFVTADGQIWQQNESKDIGLPPRTGTAFTVEKGALGSFICKAGSSRSFRCRRQG